MTGEFRLIERLKRLIPPSLQGPFKIGDDTAILPTGRGKCLLFTTDAIVEGIDFRTGKGGAMPEAIGRKALAVNLSDIAAMGGKPTAFVCAWGIPKKFSQGWVEHAAKGMIRLAREFEVKWVGGDLSGSSQAFISIALLGEGQIQETVQRKGARPGDSLYVTGKLGGSIEGKHLYFTPRIREARFLVAHFKPSAMIDISDGFIQDLEHLLKASRVGARVDLERIPVSKAAWQGKRGQSAKKRRVPFSPFSAPLWAMKSALTDGEDFELLFTVSKGRTSRLEAAWRKQFPHVLLTRVGEIDSGSSRIQWFQKGKRVKRLWFRKKGFAHF